MICTGALYYTPPDHPKQWAWGKSCFAVGQLQPKRSPFLIKWEQLHRFLCFLDWGRGTSFCIPTWKWASDWGWFVVFCSPKGCAAPFPESSINAWQIRKGNERVLCFYTHNLCWNDVLSEVSSNNLCCKTSACCGTGVGGVIPKPLCAVARIRSSGVIELNGTSRYLPQKRWASHCSRWRMISSINSRSKACCWAFLIRSRRGKLPAG